jgi:hypothetical protein
VRADQPAFSDGAVGAYPFARALGKSDLLTAAAAAQGFDLWMASTGQMHREAYHDRRTVESRCQQPGFVRAQVAVQPIQRSWPIGTHGAKRLGGVRFRQLW